MKPVEERHYTRLMVSLTAGILLMVGYIFYLLFGPYKVPILNNIHPTDPVQAGQLARYEAADCSLTDQEAEISRVLVSETHTPQIVIGLDSAIIRKLSCSNIILVPLATPTGDYHIVISAKIQVSALRSVLHEYHSVPFHIQNANPDIVIPPSPLSKAPTPAAEVPTNAPGVYNGVPTVVQELSPRSTPTPQPVSQSAPQSAPQPNPQPGPQPQPTFLEQVSGEINGLLKGVGL